MFGIQKGSGGKVSQNLGFTFLGIFKSLKCQKKPEKEQNESQLFPCIRKWTEAEMGSPPNCSFMREQLFT